MNGQKTLGVNALLNGIKQTCSVLFPLISFVYCSRILGRNNIGRYSFGNSIVSYFLLIAGLGIANYAVREGAEIRERGTLIDFINEVFTINVVSTFLSYILLFVVLFSWPKVSTYKTLILIQSIQIILTTIGADWINTIFEDYLYLTIRYIIIQIVSLGILIAFVHQPDDLYIYAVITVLSNSGGNILNIGYLRKKRGVSLHLVPLDKTKKHLPSIIVLFFNSVASVIYLNSDITMLGALTNDGLTGIYTISSRIYSMTKTIINAIVMVTIPRFSYYVANNMKEKFMNSANKVLEVLLFFSVPVMVGMLAESKNILLLVGGKEYIGGETSLKILSFAFIFAVLACFNSYSILLPNHRETFFMISTIIAALTNISLNFILIRYFNIDGAALTTLIAEIIVFCMTGICSRKYFEVKVSVKSIICLILGGAFTFFICTLNNLTISNSILQLLISLCECGVVYFLIFLRFRRKLRFNFE